MTVAELIEALQQLPGAADFRPVTLMIDAHRDNRSSIRCEVRNITSVRVDRDVCVVQGWGWDANAK